MVVKIEPGSKTKTILRKYQTPIQILSDVGGFNEVLLFIGSIIYSWYNSRSLNSYLRQEIVKKDTPKVDKKLNPNSSYDIEKVVQEIIDSR